MGEITFEMGAKAAQVRVNGECVTFIDYEYVTPRFLRSIAKRVEEMRKWEEE